MKHCPSCQRAYDDAQKFCLQDGTPLADGAPASSAGAASFGGAQPPGPTSPPPPPQPRSTFGAGPGGGGAQGYGAPPPPPHAGGAPRKRKVWPFVLGGVVVLGVGFIALLIVGALFLRRNLPDRNVNVNVNTNAANLNANRNRSLNADTVVGGGNTNGAAAGDDDAVMAELTKLENDWIRANIAADKEALERILADEYIGTSSSGEVQNKQQYLENIEPDETVVSWDSEDVRLMRKGDAAVLTGVLVWNTKEGSQRYRFTDTFVRREGRWQALSSQTAPAR